MASYDPQRNRVRSRAPGDDEPAPVDVLLGAPTPTTPPIDTSSDLAAMAPTDEPVTAHSHTHGPDCDHEHDPATGLDVRVFVAAGVAALAAVVVLVRRSRRSR